MPTIITMLLVTLMLMTGCAPQWMPYWPDYAATYHYPAEKAVLRAHQPILDVGYRYTLPVYTPVREYLPPRSATYSVSPLQPGQ